MSSTSSSSAVVPIGGAVVFVDTDEDNLFAEMKHQNVPQTPQTFPPPFSPREDIALIPPRPAEEGQGGLLPTHPTAANRSAFPLPPPLTIMAPSSTGEGPPAHHYPLPEGGPATPPTPASQSLACPNRHRLVVRTAASISIRDCGGALARHALRCSRPPDDDNTAAASPPSSLDTWADGFVCDRCDAFVPSYSLVDAGGGGGGGHCLLPTYAASCPKPTCRYDICLSCVSEIEVQQSSHRYEVETRDGDENDDDGNDNESRAGGAVVLWNSHLCDEGHTLVLGNDLLSDDVCRVCLTPIGGAPRSYFSCSGKPKGETEANGQKSGKQTKEGRKCRFFKCFDCVFKSCEGSVNLCGCEGGEGEGRVPSGGVGPTVHPHNLVLTHDPRFISTVVGGGCCVQFSFDFHCHTCNQHVKDQTSCLVCPTSFAPSPVVIAAAVSGAVAVANNAAPMQYVRCLDCAMKRVAAFEEERSEALVAREVRLAEVIRRVVASHPPATVPAASSDGRGERAVQESRRLIGLCKKKHRAGLRVSREPTALPLDLDLNGFGASSSPLLLRRRMAQKQKQQQREQPYPPPNAYPRDKWTAARIVGFILSGVLNLAAAACVWALLISNAWPWIFTDDSQWTSESSFPASNGYFQTRLVTTVDSLRAERVVSQVWYRGLSVGVDVLPEKAPAMLKAMEPFACDRFNVTSQANAGQYFYTFVDISQLLWSIFVALSVAVIILAPIIASISRVFQCFDGDTARAPAAWWEEELGRWRSWRSSVFPFRSAWREFWLTGTRAQSLPSCLDDFWWLAVSDCVLGVVLPLWAFSFTQWGEKSDLNSSSPEEGGAASSSFNPRVWLYASLGVFAAKLALVSLQQGHRLFMKSGDYVWGRIRMRPGKGVLCALQALQTMSATSLLVLILLMIPSNIILLSARRRNAADRQEVNFGVFLSFGCLNVRCLWPMGSMLWRRFRSPATAAIPVMSVAAISPFMHRTEGESGGQAAVSVAAPLSSLSLGDDLADVAISGDASYLGLLQSSTIIDEDIFWLLRAYRPWLVVGSVLVDAVVFVAFPVSELSILQLEPPARAMVSALASFGCVRVAASAFGAWLRIFTTKAG